MSRKTEVAQEQEYWRELSDRLGWTLVSHTYKSEVTYRDQHGYLVELTGRQRDTIVTALQPIPAPSEQKPPVAESATTAPEPEREWREWDETRGWISLPHVMKDSVTVPPRRKQWRTKAGEWKEAGQ